MAPHWAHLGVRPVIVGPGIWSGPGRAGPDLVLFPTTTTTLCVLCELVLLDSGSHVIKKGHVMHTYLPTVPLKRLGMCGIESSSVFKYPSGELYSKSIDVRPLIFLQQMYFL